MPQRELIGPNAPQHATLPLSGQEVIHAVQNGESVVIFPEDIVPESAAPTAHAASHASNGADPITPASIGAATVDALSEALDDIDADLADVDSRLDDLEAAPSGQDFAPAPAVHTAATLTLTDDHRNSVLRVSGASNAVAIRIPDTLTGGEVGDATAFETAILVTDLTHAVTIATGVGLLTPEEHYGPELITEVNTWVVVKVARGKAYMAVVPPGVDAVESAPLVQGVHTSATRTIAPSDVGTIIPFSGQLQAVAITVPHTLFGSQGANKGFVFCGEVRNITNPITLAGSGGLVLVPYGPRTTLTTVGDVFTVVVISATVAWVFIAAKL